MIARNAMAWAGVRLLSQVILGLTSPASFLAIGGVDYTAVRKFSPCSYAFVVEQNWFEFNASYVKSREFGERYGFKGLGVPLVLDWSVGDQTCDEAKNNKSSYACAAPRTANAYASLCAMAQVISASVLQVMSAIPT